MFIKRKKINKREIRKIKKAIFRTFKDFLKENNISKKNYSNFRKEKWLINYLIVLMMMSKKIINQNYSSLSKRILNSDCNNRICKCLSNDFSEKKFLDNFVLEKSFCKNKMTKKDYIKLINYWYIVYEIFLSNADLFKIKKIGYDLLIYYFTNNFFNVKFKKYPKNNLNDEYQKKINEAISQCNQIKNIYAQLRKIFMNDFSNITCFINYSSKNMI